MQTRPIIEAASNAIRLWPDGEEPVDEEPSSEDRPAGSTSMFTIGGPAAKVPRRQQPDGDATLTAAHRRYVRKSLQRAIEILDQL